MGNNISDVTIHIDENISHHDRELLRDSYLHMQGVVSADSRDERPHLMIVAYDPEQVNSGDLLAVASKKGLHAELIGL